MHIVIYERLKELARSGRLTTYSEIAPLAGLSMSNEVGRIKISGLLEEILYHEVSEGRPLLTALVGLKGNNNMPGEGFFTAATNLLRFNGSHDQMKRLEFWANAVREVHTYWESH